MRSSVRRLVLCVPFLLMAALARGEELKSEEIYRRTSASVVTLSVTTEGGGAVGSAFFAFREGLAVTAWHVVRGAKRVVARTVTGEEFESSGLVDKDEKRDVALIRIKVAGRPLLPVADGDPEVGSKAFLVGAPRALEFSITDGLISQVRLDGGVKVYQFSCPASPGNSGGPLVNAAGQVIGIVSFQRTDGQNLNFAMPVIYAKGLDSTLRTQPWENVKSSPFVDSTPGVPESGVLSPEELDRALGEAEVLRTNATLWFDYTEQSVVHKNWGLRKGVPPLLYAMERDLTVQAQRLNRVTAPDSTREKLRAWHVSNFPKMAEGIRHMSAGIVAAGRLDGWFATAKDEYHRALGTFRVLDPYPTEAAGELLEKSKLYAAVVTDNGKRPRGKAAASGLKLGFLSPLRNELLVLSLQPKGLADQLGIELGDRIVSAGGSPVQTIGELQLAIQAAAGKKLEIVVTRSEKARTLHSKVPADLGSFQ